jgi:uncharacterized protein (DUF433 family)
MENPRDIPTYEIAEAAHYLHLPVSTLGHWVRGHKKFKRVIDTPGNGSAGPIRLSFLNLVEAHMLATIRRKYGIRLQNIRPAIDYLQREFGEPHPLATMSLKVDEVNLFVERAGKLLNISRGGQVAMKQAVQEHLKRVKRDRDNNPLVLYPFVGGDYTQKRKPVMFDPEISFGRLVIVKSGIPTTEIAERFGAGETIAALSKDFGLTALQVEDAIRCEIPLKEAA